MYRYMFSFSTDFMLSRGNVMHLIEISFEPKVEPS